MKIAFTGQDTPEQWFREFASKFNITVDKDTLSFPPSIGKGFMKQYRFFDGMTLTCFHMYLRESLEFIREPSDNQELLPIFFYSQENTLNQYIKEGEKPVGFHTENGVFMCSSQIGSRWSVPAHTDDYQITLSVRKNWLFSNLENSKSPLYETICSNQPYYLFESLTTEMRHTILSIRAIMEQNPPFQKLELHQKSLDLLIQFLKQLNVRPSENQGYRISPDDVEKVFSVRKEILNALPYSIPVSRLAETNGMSLRKLQSVFKNIFGKSISQFCLAEKMQRASELLTTGNYTVSEVGYMMGYSNLSHFSQAFKNRFGELPKRYSQKLDAPQG